MDCMWSEFYMLNAKLQLIYNKSLITIKIKILVIIISLKFEGKTDANWGHPE